MFSTTVFGAPGEKLPAPRPSTKMYLPKGEIEAAWLFNGDPYAGVRSRKSGAQKAGLAYQKRIGAFLNTNPSWSVAIGPWYIFVDGSGARHYCQPDFLLWDEKKEKCIIVEVKVRWTADAWWQLTKLYKPVLRKAYPDCGFCRLTICRSYDPHLPSPEEVYLPLSIVGSGFESFNVLVIP